MNSPPRGLLMVEAMSAEDLDAAAPVPDWDRLRAQGGAPDAPAARLRNVYTIHFGELNKALDNTEVKERLTQAGNELIGGTPAQAADFIRADVDRWRQIIKPEMRINR